MENEQDKDDNSCEKCDEINDDEYVEDDRLPTPFVSSLRGNTNLDSQKINAGKTMVNISTAENMNKISSFRLKEE